MSGSEKAARISGATVSSRSITPVLEKPNLDALVTCNGDYATRMCAIGCLVSLMVLAEQFHVTRMCVYLCS